MSLTTLPSLPKPEGNGFFNCGAAVLPENAGIATMEAQAESLYVGDVAYVLDESEQTVRRLFDGGVLRGPRRRHYRRIYVDSLQEYGLDERQNERLGKVLSRIAAAKRRKRKV